MLSSPPPTPVAPAARAAVIQQRLDALVATGVPGAVVLVRDGRQVFRLAAGTSDFATGRPMRSTTASASPA